MSLAVLNSCALTGIKGEVIHCEVHISSGLPAFNIVGLPDAGVRESKERVRSALLTSGYQYPAGRITANLSPADLPKDSGRYDLALALGILLASGQIQLSTALTDKLHHLYFAAELSLTGAIVPVKGALVLALAIHELDKKAELYVSKENALEAAYIDGFSLYGVNTLKELVDYLNGTTLLKPIAMNQLGIKEELFDFCFSDVKGQEQACHMLEVAASGGHGVLLVGPPGVGKSMMAQRLPSILPNLSQSEHLETLALYSLSKKAQLNGVQKPFRAPHHSSSLASLVGGGQNPQPGEISLAHHGVLFLDELPEFQRNVLEALREPLEKGEICISRAKHSVVFPAQFQLIAAANPCPCGYHGHQHIICRCSPEKIQNYQLKFSGPLLDRIDIHLNLLPLPEHWMQSKKSETSINIKQRVIATQKTQIERQNKLNVYLSPKEVEHYCQLSASNYTLFEKASQKFSWSGRTAHRILKVARTIADQHNHSIIEKEDLIQAFTVRQAKLF